MLNQLICHECLCVVFPSRDGRCQQRGRGRSALASRGAPACPCAGTPGAELGLAAVPLLPKLARGLGLLGHGRARCGGQIRRGEWRFCCLLGSAGNRCLVLEMLSVLGIEWRWQGRGRSCRDKHTKSPSSS